MRFHISRRVQWVGPLVGFASIVLAVPGCASSREERPPPRSSTTYQQRHAAQMEARQDFIADTQKRIDAIEDRISELESRIGPEWDMFSATEQSEWREELNQLEREKEQARARLERARTASLDEWRIWRTDIAVQVERLESSVETLATRVDAREAEVAAERELEEEREPVGGEDEPLEGETEGEGEEDVHHDYELAPP